MKNQLKQILLEKSVITGKEFTLSSGRKSSFYVDARITTLDPAGAFLCGNIFFDMLKDFNADAVGGYSIGADPIVSAIAVVSHIRKAPVPAFIIRKESKTYGTGRQIEGNFPKNGRVVIFDDVVTSGGSILRGARAVEQLGGIVLAVMAVIDRNEGGREAIETAGYPFRAIFCKEDFGIVE